MLLHAFPVDARMWDGVRGHLEEQVRLITPDQRGMGESPLDGSPAWSLADPESAEANVPPDLDLVAADVVALLDRLELSRVVLGGCSMGGYVAMGVLRRAPERVAGLLLVDTKAVADDEQQRANRLSVAERVEREGVSWLAETNPQSVLGRTTLQQRPEAVDRMRELINAQSPEGIAWAQRAMAGRPDSTGTLRSFSGPALVVAGEEDPLTPPQAARQLAELLEEGEQVSVPRVGHLPPLEDPEAFVAAIRPWLQQFS